MSKTKIEPLKDKIIFYQRKIWYYKPEDIKSAVEWLKQHLREPYVGFEDKKSKENILGLIDMAFEDVTRKTGESSKG